MQENENPKLYKISVITGGESDPVVIYCADSMDLMEAMQQQGIYINSSCSGRGTCGSCKVRILEGKLSISKADRERLTDQELEQGWRLSCQAYPKEDVTLKLTETGEADFEIVTEHGQADLETAAKNCRQIQEDYSVAIDIGTTTIAICLIGNMSGRSYRTYACSNRQRIYGTDVISRIQASNNGKKTMLQDSIRADLLQGINTIIKKTGIRPERIKKIAIAGNTTMRYLLLGSSCEVLGRYPYTPVDTGRIELSFYELTGSNYLEAPAVILPGISAFVGGDITAGLLFCDFDQADKPCLFIDLGTNGEIAVGNKDRLLVSSTAAGPAFEGSNISCGIPSIAGAICSLEIRDSKVNCHTIGDKAPVGICGTGIVELVSELFRAGLMDKTGLLCEDYFEEGFSIAEAPEGNPIRFTQKDIREVQLAKAAIRAGLDIIIREYGITYDEIDKVYLAGGFGYKINIEKAIHIGLLPKELSGKIISVGNSSLGGAIRYLHMEQSFGRLQHIIEVSGEIYLSNHKDFNELYIGHMSFC